MKVSKATHHSSWAVRKPWRTAIGFALIPVIFTAAGSAATQIAKLSDMASTLMLAAAILLSACTGLLIMKKSPVSFRNYGFRTPLRLKDSLWFLPAIASLVLVLVTQGIQVSGTLLTAYLALSVAAGINEELWFRGLIFSALRSRSVRTAVVGTSVLFGVLHLANLAGGETPLESVLQLIFAVAFGFAAAELVVITGSLVPVIVWHAAWDFLNYAGGNSLSAIPLSGLAIATALIVAYAIFLSVAVKSRIKPSH